MKLCGAQKRRRKKNEKRKACLRSLWRSTANMEIAECMGVTPPTVNVSIQRLEKADIVCRKRDDKDQRIMRVYLTENGRKIVEELQQESKAVEKVMFSNFSEAELCLLRRFFGQILDNISEIPVNR